MDSIQGPAAYFCEYRAEFLGSTASGQLLDPLNRGTAHWSVLTSLSGESSKNILETDCNTEHSDIALKSDNVTAKMDFILVIILTVQNCTILDLW